MSGTLTHALPFGEYLALPGAHFTALTALDTSPLHYRRALEHGRKDTSAMTLGRATHAAILTPDLPSDATANVVVYDGIRRGKKWEAFKVDHPDATIMIASEVEAQADARAHVESMRAAVFAHPVAAELLRDGDPEVTLRWEDERTGVDCRARIDWLRRDGGIVEVKTTRRIGKRAFPKESSRLLYHAQVAFYEDGLTAARGQHSDCVSHIIAIENVPPHDVCVYRMVDRVIEAGRRKVDFWLRDVAACEAAHRWPGVAAQPIDMTLENWVEGDGLDDVDASGLEAAQ